MNLYDEVIEELQDLHVDIVDAFGHNATNYNPQIIFKALERAKKVEELLGLYQEMWKLPYGDIRVVELLRQINQLEEELK